MHLEFVVLGPPVSNQSKITATLRNWKTAIEAEVRACWNSPILTGELKGVIINFYAGVKPSPDVDNMSKPIFDVMNKLVYHDDRQIHQAEIAHVRIDTPLVFVGVVQLIADAVRAGNEFVYVRIEDPVTPYPLPR